MVKENLTVDLSPRGQLIAREQTGQRSGTAGATGCFEDASIKRVHKWFSGTLYPESIVSSPLPIICYWSKVGSLL